MNRLKVELVEADVEIGFCLVDLAHQQSNTGDSSAAARILQDADEVLADIDRRLRDLTTADQACFAPLVAELRRELAQAKSSGQPPGR